MNRLIVVAISVTLTNFMYFIWIMSLPAIVAFIMRTLHCPFIVRKIKTVGTTKVQEILIYCATSDMRREKITNFFFNLRSPPEYFGSNTRFNFCTASNKPITFLSSTQLFCPESCKHIYVIVAVALNLLKPQW